MLRRKITERLDEWRSRPHKCLVLKGQRQVGKTYSVREFGRTRYKNMVEFDLSTDKRCRSIFDGSLDVDTIVSAMKLFRPGQPIEPGSTLIFIDEIQEYPPAREALKPFTEDGRFDVIASGSMLGVNISFEKGEAMIPVGYEEHLTMFGLDFEEFCWANGVGNEHIEMVKRCIKEKKPLGPAFCERFKTIFRDFMLIGGMPEAVQMFVDTKDYSEVGRIQNDLIESCRKDINRYNDGIDRIKTMECFDSIPSQLAESNKRFTFSRIDGGSSRNSASKYRDNILWIEGAGYGNMCRALSALEKPLSRFVKRDQFKVYLSDTGMLMQMYGRGSKEELFIGDPSFNAGAIAENVIAECLMKSGIRIAYYRKNGGKDMMEIDFVIELGREIVAIEVKSGKKRESPSISKVGKVFDVERRIMFEDSDIRMTDDGIEHYPLFAAGFATSMETERNTTKF